MNNIEVFRDTERRINTDERLKALTQQAINDTHIYESGFRSEKSPYHEDARVSFQGTLTLISALEQVKTGNKTAVLNFANPVEPGGGVLRGANAQEEYLCRASNLYFTLISEQASPYYRYHNELRRKNGSGSHMFLATDMIIYSPQVTVIREDVGYDPASPNISYVQQYTEIWNTIDVITCAAPCFYGSIQIPYGDLEHLFKLRIKNILETAIENDIDALILGAFGCGAFHNPPMVVANAFQSVLMEPRYRYAFREVVFAVMRSAAADKNVRIFEETFSDLASV